MPNNARLIPVSWLVRVAGAVVVFAAGAVVTLHARGRLATPSVGEFWARLPPVSLGTIFSYDKKSLGLLLVKAGGVPAGLARGMQGFVTVDIDKSRALDFVKALNEIVVVSSEAFDVWEDEGAEENETLPDSSDETWDAPESLESPEVGGGVAVGPEPLEDEPETSDATSLESPFDAPVKRLIEEVWNAGLLRMGGVAIPELSFAERIGFTFFAESGERAHANLTDLFLDAAPSRLQHHLLSEVLRLAVLEIDRNERTGIVKGLLQLDAFDVDLLADSLCSAEERSWDACGLLNLDRPKWREQAAQALGLLGDDFRVQLHFYWALRGSAVIWSNDESYVARLLGPPPPAAVPKVEERPFNEVLTQVVPGVPASDFRFAITSQTHRLQDALLTILASARLAEPGDGEDLSLPDVLHSPETEMAETALEEQLVRLNEVSDFLALVGIVKDHDIEADLWYREPQLGSRRVESESDSAASELLAHGARVLGRVIEGFANAGKTEDEPPAEVVFLKAPRLVREGPWLRVEGHVGFETVAPLLREQLLSRSEDKRYF